MDMFAEPIAFWGLSAEVVSELSTVPQDSKMNVVVALKLLDRGEDTLAVTEASALKNLESDHILPVLNAGVHNDVPFVVTEIAAGGTAEGRLKRRPHGLDAGLVIRWARQTLTAVDYCHRMRVLHRDITPSNVFLVTDDHARLGDFGAAASLDTSGSTDRHGNPLILAPDGLETGRLTTRSEIYSVGATVWRLLTVHGHMKLPRRQAFSKRSKANADRASPR